MDVWSVADLSKPSSAATGELTLHAHKWTFQKKGLPMVGAGGWGGWHTGQWLIYDPPDLILGVSLQLPWTAKMPAGHCIAQEDIIAAPALGPLHCRVVLAAEWFERGDTIHPTHLELGFLAAS